MFSAEKGQERQGLLNHHPKSTSRGIGDLAITERCEHRNRQHIKDSTGVPLLSACQAMGFAPP